MNNIGKRIPKLSYSIKKINDMILRHQIQLSDNEDKMGVIHQDVAGR